jgi:hypothetical protein
MLDLSALLKVAEAPTTEAIECNSGLLDCICLPISVYPSCQAILWLSAVLTAGLSMTSAFSTRVEMNHPYQHTFPHI